MRAAVFRGARRLEITDIPIPEIGPEEVLVQVHYCGICGSDLEAFHTGMYEPGIIIGHEFAGEVVQIGKKARRFSLGEGIVVNDAIVCGRCPSCRHGQPTLCDNLLMPGVTLNGGMAEYVAVPEQALHRLPEGVSMRQAALVEPLSVALHGVRRSGLESGDQVLVMGAGTIGLLTLQCALLAGARDVYVSDVNPHRTALAQRLGASAAFDPTRQNLAVELGPRTGSRGPTVVYICTGAPAAFEDAVTLVAKGGQIIVLGLGVEAMSADYLTVVLHELRIMGSYLGYEEFPEALNYIADARVDVETLISHEITLDEVVTKGFEISKSSDAGTPKVLVRLIH